MIKGWNRLERLARMFFAKAGIAPKPAILEISPLWNRQPKEYQIPLQFLETCVAHIPASTPPFTPRAKVCAARWSDLAHIIRDTPVDLNSDNPEFYRGMEMAVQEVANALKAKGTGDYVSMRCETFDHIYHHRGILHGIHEAYKPLPNDPKIAVLSMRNQFVSKAEFNERRLHAHLAMYAFYNHINGLTKASVRSQKLLPHIVQIAEANHDAVMRATGINHNT